MKDLIIVLSQTSVLIAKPVTPPPVDSRFIPAT